MVRFRRRTLATRYWRRRRGPGRSRFRRKLRRRRTKTIRKIQRVRKTRFRNLSTQFNPGLFPAPDRQMVRFRWEFHFTYSETQTSGGAIGPPLVINGNQAWHPNSSDLNDNPTGYDIFAEQYKLATVISSGMKIMVIDAGTDAAFPLKVAIIPQRSVEPNLTLSQLTHTQEVRYNSAKYIEPTQASPYSTNWIKNYMKTNTLFGIGAKEVKDDHAGYAYSNVVPGSYPVNQWDWRVYVVAPWVDDVDVPIIVRIRVLVNYYVLFTRSDLRPDINEAP